MKRGSISLINSEDEQGFETEFKLSNKKLKTSSPPPSKPSSKTSIPSSKTSIPSSKTSKPPPKTSKSSPTKRLPVNKSPPPTPRRSTTTTTTTTTTTSAGIKRVSSKPFPPTPLRESNNHNDDDDDDDDDDKEDDEDENEDDYSIDGDQDDEAQDEDQDQDQDEDEANYQPHATWNHEFTMNVLKEMKMMAESNNYNSVQLKKVANKMSRQFKVKLSDNALKNKMSELIGSSPKSKYNRPFKKPSPHNKEHRVNSSYEEYVKLEEALYNECVSLIKQIREARYNKDVLDNTETHRKPGQSKEAIEEANSKRKDEKRNRIDIIEKSFKDEVGFRGKMVERLTELINQEDERFKFEKRAQEIYIEAFHKFVQTFHILVGFIIKKNDDNNGNNGNDDNNL